MTTQVKPGTRCECDTVHASDPNFPNLVEHFDRGAYDGKRLGCNKPAVRLVTVDTRLAWTIGGKPKDRPSVPMCLACARWHEERAHA